MPTPPPPTTVQGAVVRLLQADAGLLALVPAGNVVAGEEAEERDIGAGFVLVHDEQDVPLWFHQTSRQETHHLKVMVYAKAAAAAGQDNPAEAIGKAVDAAVGWQDLPIPNTLPVAFLKTLHTPARVSRRRAPDKERVYEVELRWDVVIVVEG
jgi:hypothetical protein